MYILCWYDDKRRNFFEFLRRLNKTIKNIEINE